MPEAVLNNLDAQLAVGSRLREEKAAADADNVPPAKGGIGGLKNYIYE